MAVARLVVVGDGDRLDVQAERQVDRQLLRAARPCGARRVPAGEHGCGPGRKLLADTGGERSGAARIAKGEEGLDTVGRIVVV
ncbi:unannotated protein [freshwater metagenome]|uniref:Unannotated protein n=1 Tax=freshwater metagenome TaxID=449393 RepID=A0A6J7M778_9ZZZZ